MPRVDEKPQRTHWPGCWRYHHDCAVTLVEKLADALAGQITHWYNLSGGIDLDADSDNVSLEDADAHTGRLAVKEAFAMIARVYDEEAT